MCESPSLYSKRVCSTVSWWCWLPKCCTTVFSFLVNSSVRVELSQSSCTDCVSATMRARTSMSVRTRGRTMLLAFFVLLGALAAEASASPKKATRAPRTRQRTTLLNVQEGPAASPLPAPVVSSPPDHPRPEQVMTTSVPLSATSRPPPARLELQGSPDIGPLPRDYFARSQTESMRWTGDDAFPKLRAIPRGAILFHGSPGFRMSELGQKRLFLSPQSSAALAAAVLKHAYASGETSVVAKGRPSRRQTIQLFEFVVATDVLNVVYLPHSSLKVQQTLNTYATSNPFPPTMGQPSLLMDNSFTEFCAHNVRPGSFFGWRSPWDQDEVMVCPWKDMPVHSGAPVRSLSAHAVRQSVISAPRARDRDAGAARSVSPAHDQTDVSAPPSRAPRPPRGLSAPPHSRPPPVVGPLELRRVFSCDVEKIRELLAAGVVPNTRAQPSTFVNYKHIREVTYNFDQVEDPTLTYTMDATTSATSTGTPIARSPNWSALFAFHMQLAGGLSISQLLTPWVEGEPLSAPCAVVNDYTASINYMDPSLAADIEAVAARRLTDPF